MKKLLLVLLLIFTAVDFSAAEATSPDDLIKQFYADMKTEHQMSADELDIWFKDVTVNQKIIDNMNRPAEKTLTWDRYRKIFIQKDRIDQGVSFWQKHLDTLNRAEETYGVPAHLIVSLIGVETKYGRILGRFDIFRSLYTLAFHYPRRAKFFTGELKAFLVLAKQEGWDVGSMKGSYAGAMGYGQFMPTSYQAYAVDFDGDGKINLVKNVVDAIGSVANYIKQHRWQKGAPIVKQVSVTSDAADKLLSTGLKPNRTVATLRAAGVDIPADISDETKVLFFKLKTDKDNYWIGFDNFYVISRYNPRVFYVKAVTELAEEIKAGYTVADVSSKAAQ